MGILSEISFVRQFMSSRRKPRYDKEDLCIPLLMHVGKTGARIPRVRSEYVTIRDFSERLEVGVYDDQRHHRESSGRREQGDEKRIAAHHGVILLPVGAVCREVQHAGHLQVLSQHGDSVR